MDWRSVYRDNFVKLEWRDKQDKKRYLRAYKGAEVRLDDVILSAHVCGGGRHRHRRGFDNEGQD